MIFKKFIKLMNLKIQNKTNYKKCFDNVLILCLIFINNINNIYKYNIN